MDTFHSNFPDKYHENEIKFFIGLYADFNINLMTHKIQSGGGKEIENIVTFIDSIGTFTFRVLEKIQESMIHLSILSSKNDECITVIIWKKTKTAILHNMSYFNDCAKEGLKKPGGGSILLKFILNYLIDNKLKYNINKIVLSDNSYLYCNNCDDTIKLARLRLITHGKTWYMKYGFKPYNSDKNKPDDELLKDIEYNNNKISKLLTNELAILELVKSIKNINIKELERLINKYKLLKDFIDRISKEYDKYCCLLVEILDYLYKAERGKIPILIDVYKKPYYRNL